MRVRKLLLHLLFALFPLLSQADEESWAEWATDSIEKMPADPGYRDLLSLAAISTNRSAHPKVVEVRRKAWARLQSVPNFADRFLLQMHTEREKWLNRSSPNSAHYNSTRQEVLEAFSKLPHPSVVRAMGELLEDDEWPYPGGVDPGFDGCCFPLPPNSLLAARALGRLLSTDPVGKGPSSYTKKEVEAWRLWFRKVKDGKLGYRFEGSTKVYNLSGPWPQTPKGGPTPE